MLDELILRKYVDLCTTELGIDSYDQCLDKEHFANFQTPVYYFFNSRGFRDNEWPDAIENKIWCVGDSFTIGLGQPFEDIWPQQIEGSINISLNGASNDWIARKAEYIIKNAKPKAVFIQWSYLHRRENQNSDLEDELRMMHYDPKDSNDLENFKKNVLLVEQNKFQVPTIHSFIPKFYNLNDEDIDPSIIFKFMDSISANYFREIEPIDLARDSHHYGKNTAKIYANSYLKKLEGYVD